MMNRALLIPATLVLLASAVACGGSSDAPGADPSTGSGAAAAARGSGDGDMAEISNRTLTMADVERWYDAQRNIYRAVQRDPAIARQLEGDEEESTGQMTLDDVAERYASVPAVRQGIEAAGLEVRDFGVISLTLLQASFANAAIDMGADRDSVLASSGVKPANLDFVRENRARLDQLQAEIAAMVPDDGDEESGGA